jgi:hypothetical protein
MISEILFFIFGSVFFLFFLLFAFCFILGGLAALHYSTYRQLQEAREFRDQVLLERTPARKQNSLVSRSSNEDGE